MISDLINLKKIAYDLANKITIGDVICLHGDLGAGKTTFAKLLVNELCQKETDVASPSFNIVLTYNSPKGLIWHYDLYRIKHVEELEEIGLSEALTSGITIVEWPEIAREFMIHNNIIDINFNFVKNDHNKREITINNIPIG
jgi:tRNA threonylcarbamoyladenosine biosynthesis protein TsaE